MGDVSEGNRVRWDTFTLRCLLDTQMEMLGDSGMSEPKFQGPRRGDCDGRQDHGHKPGQDRAGSCEQLAVHSQGNGRGGMLGGALGGSKQQGWEPVDLWKGCIDH